jgi:hypothetical protein
LDPVTLTVLGVAGWTARFAADQLMQHAGATAAGVATARVEQFMKSVRGVTPTGSPIGAASSESFRDASKYLHQRLTDELEVGLLRRGRPDAQWCAAFRKLVADDDEIARFLTEVDPTATRGDATAEEVVEQSFHQSYLRWLRARQLGEEPEVVESWLLQGIPGTGTAAPSMLYDRYLEHFDHRYRTDAEVKAALDTVRFEALMGAVDQVPRRTADVIASDATRRAADELGAALADHLSGTVAANARLRLPLHDADGHEVRIGIDELYLDLPLELPPGTEGPPTDELLPSTFAERVANDRRDAPQGPSSKVDGPGAQAPPSLSVATCLAHRPRLLLTGGPGSGKSSVVRFLAWHYGQLADGAAPRIASAQAAELASRLPEQPWVPVVVRCKDLSPDELRSPLRDVVAAQLAREGEVAVDQVTPLAQELLERIRTGDALLLVDGLDEVEDAARQALCETLERELARHDRMALVATSRHTGLSQVLATLGPAVDHYEIATLRHEHQVQFLTEWEQLAERLGTDATAADDLREVVTGTRELSRLGEFIQPLTLIAQVHLRDGQIPRNRAKLYRRAVGDLLRSRSGERHIDEVWPEMTHLAYRMHESGAVVWDMYDAEAAIDQFLELARAHGLDRRLRRPLPQSGAQWLADAVQLAILNQSGRTDRADELDDGYGDDLLDELDDGFDEGFDDELDASGRAELAARLEFCHLAFQEFCAAHAVLSPHRVIARG